MNGKRSFVPMVRGYVLPSRQIVARLLTILENRQDDLRQMQKNKSRSMLQQQPEQYRQGLNVLPKFLQAQKKPV